MVSLLHPTGSDIRTPLLAVLESERVDAVEAAISAIGHLHHSHYESAGLAETRRRIERLYDAVLDAADKRNLGAIVGYAEQLAKGRHATGCTLPELQAAFNALEEALWERLVAALPPARIAEALTLVGSIFGVAKDTLACAYVVAATRTCEPAIDLESLAAGGSNAGFVVRN